MEKSERLEKLERLRVGVDGEVGEVGVDGEVREVGVDGEVGELVLEQGKLARE